MANFKVGDKVQLNEKTHEPDAGGTSYRDIHDWSDKGVIMRVSNFPDLVFVRWDDDIASDGRGCDAQWLELQQ